MATIVEVAKLKKKDTKLNEMFEWCFENCHLHDGALKPYWGTSWWTECSNTQFHFKYEDDAIMFKLRF